ncbi:MAG: hypothetical protein U9R39_03150 [Campylobacterota bacterium]|nr:hypothetical protein [Campylobacterota bacterium]
MIQTLLGNFNDYEVHRCKLNFFINELNITGQQLKTLNKLIKKYTKEQEIIKTQFQYKFEKFNQKEFRDILLNFKVMN